MQIPGADTLLDEDKTAKHIHVKNARRDEILLEMIPQVRYLKASCYITYLTRIRHNYIFEDNI